MELLSPQLGLFVWTLIIFLAFFFLLRRVAWKPILKAVHDREKSIENSLREAEAARDEMQRLTAKNEEIIKQANQEASSIIGMANDAKDKLMSEAKKAADELHARKMRETEAEIEHAKKAAITEMRNMAGRLSIEIAEELLKRELSKDGAQQKLIDEMVQRLNAN